MALEWTLSALYQRIKASLMAQPMEAFMEALNPALMDQECMSICRK